MPRQTRREGREGKGALLHSARFQTRAWKPLDAPPPPRSSGGHRAAASRRGGAGRAGPPSPARGRKPRAPSGRAGDGDACVTLMPRGGATHSRRPAARGQSGASSAEVPARLALLPRRLHRRPPLVNTVSLRRACNVVPGPAASRGAFPPRRRPRQRRWPERT